MEKLLQLLNEYTPTNDLEGKEYFFEKGSIWIKYFTFGGETEYVNIDTLILSKKFGFIKWLVERRKVEWFLIPEIIKKVEVDSSGLHDYNEYYEDWESLLMHLSIQDDPIEFLISILK